MATLLKLNSGWKNLETNEVIDFGQITLDIYNDYRSIYNEYYNKLYNCKTAEEHQRITEKYSDSITPEIELLLSVIESYISNLNDVDGFKPVIKFSSSNEFSYYKDRDENHQKLLDLVRQQGWKNIPTDVTLHPIDIFLLKCINNSNGLQVVPRLVDEKWYMSYTSDHIGTLLILDLIEMRNCGYKFHFCKNCSNIHIQKGTTRKYCVKCSSEYKRIADAERKNSPRYIHKNTRDYMRNSGNFTPEEIAAFSEESDYYWDRLHGKKTLPSDVTKYTAKINTLEEYGEWCKKKHAEFKSISKSRKM